MARISDLAATSKPLMSDVTIVSNGELTYKITLQNLKDTLVPRATGSVSGTVKVGSGLTINDAGVLSVTDYKAFSLPRATATTLGGVKIGNGIAIDATGTISVDYAPPVASNYSFGTVKIGEGINVDNGIISVSQTNIPGAFGDSGITVGSPTVAAFKIIDTYPSISATNFSVLDFSISSGSIKYISNDVSALRSGINKSALIADSIHACLGLPNSTWDDVYAVTLHGDLDGIAVKSNTLLSAGEYRSTNINAIADTIPVRNSDGAIAATNFIGIADKSDKLKSGSQYYSADVAASPNTFPIRDNNGDITASKFIGVSESTIKTKLGINYVLASSSNIPDTIVGRDSDGNINANVFNGVAATARYADLAERYISDNDYEIGTVLIFGGSEEVTISQKFSDPSVAGVVSEFPAYLMNQDSPGIPVALRGKVPVKVIGAVNKGDLLVTSAISGYAISIGKDKSHGVAIFAKSLENKTNHDRGTVMAVIV